MKLDMDCVRDILLEFERLPQFFRTDFVFVLVFADLLLLLLTGLSLEWCFLPCEMV